MSQQQPSDLSATEEHGNLCPNCERLQGLLAWHDSTVPEILADNTRLRAALESLTKDPPATLAREPDDDAEVIIKMRAIARAALTQDAR